MKKTKSLYWKVKISPVDDLAIDNISQADGVSRAQALRNAIRHYARFCGVWPDPDTDEITLKQDRNYMKR